MAQFLDEIQKKADSSSVPSTWRDWEIEDWLQTRYELSSKWAEGKVGEEGRDCLHDAFTQARAKYDPSRGKFSGWSFPILGFRLKDFRRRIRRRGEPVPIDEQEFPEFENEAWDREQERLDCLRAAFARMSVSDLRLLWAYSEGASIRELARRQGVSYRAMVTRLSRARCCLRTALHRAGCKLMPEVEALGDRILVSPSAFPRQCPHGPVAPHRSRRYRSK